MILALDLATKVTGWAAISDSETVVDSGIILGDHSTLEDRIHETCIQIEALIDKHDITCIVCEDMFIGRNNATGIQLARLSGAVAHLAMTRGIPFRLLHNATIKAVYAGHGKAKKSDIIAETKKRFPDIKILTDDHADAIATGITFFQSPEKAKVL